MASGIARFTFVPSTVRRWDHSQRGAGGRSRLRCEIPGAFCHLHGLRDDFVFIEILRERGSGLVAKGDREEYKQPGKRNSHSGMLRWRTRKINLELRRAGW